MNLYIDKLNLISLIDSRENKLYTDVLKLLKKQLDIFFNFSKEELKTDEKLMHWFMTFSDGVGEETINSFGNSFPDRPLKSNSHNDFDAKETSSIYLMDDEKSHVFKDSGSVLTGGVGEEIEIITRVFLRHDDYKFEKKFRIGGDEFGKWTDLNKFSLPMTEIIIVDPFILSNKNTDTDTMDINLIEFLKVLAIESNVKINLILVTHPDKMDWDYATLKTKVNHALKSVTGKKTNITLIRTKTEHDRSILTNYCRIYSGDTFNFWNSSGKKISKGREIAYSSLADIENEKMAEGFIADIQKTIIFLNKNNPDFIEGDKESRFLVF